MKPWAVLGTSDSKGKCPYLFGYVFSKSWTIESMMLPGYNMQNRLAAASPSFKKASRTESSLWREPDNLPKMKKFAKMRLEYPCMRICKILTKRPNCSDFQVVMHICFFRRTYIIKPFKLCDSEFVI